MRVISAIAIDVMVAEDDLLVPRASCTSSTRATTSIHRRLRRRDRLIEAIARHVPDVVVTDIRMPPDRAGKGLEVARRIRSSSRTWGSCAERARRAGVRPDAAGGGIDGRAYLLKERVTAAGHLVGAIQEVARGGSVIDPTVVEALVDDRLRARASPLAALTPRERQILGEIAQGKSNAAIAERSC